MVNRKCINIYNMSPCFIRVIYIIINKLVLVMMTSSAYYTDTVQMALLFVMVTEYITVTVVVG